MRGCDLDTTGEVWLYQPFQHKTEHLGKERRIGIGPEAQKVLRSFLRPGTAFLFSPREAERERRKKLMDERKTPLLDSHLRARKAKRLAHPRCKPGERYTVAAYGKAICRACEQADIPSWSPNQLRHSACTRIEREVGIEEARKVAGHAHARTTAIYAETEWQDIVKVMTKLG